MPKLKVGDEITIRVKVTAVWDGELTVLLPNGQRATILSDSPSIVDAKDRKQKRMFEE